MLNWRLFAHVTVGFGVLVVACGGEAPRNGQDPGGTPAPSLPVIDAGSSTDADSGAGADAGADVGAGADAGPIRVAGPGVAPPGAVSGERVAEPTNEMTLAASDDVAYRVEVAANEHVAFALSFDKAHRGITLSVERWDGIAPVHLGVTDAGPGLRFLAVVDASGPRTFWARVRSRNLASAAAAKLTVTRTPYADGPRCSADCVRLLQLPLPNDIARDGYDISKAVYRYQFGRRDLVMMLRYAASKIAEAGMAPFAPEDLSQWDGLTPGSDTGALRHVSHQRGKDVDISLYGLDGEAPWRSYCTRRTVSGGRECVPGSMTNFDGFANARQYAGFLQSGRVTMSFLDRELIPSVVAGARRGVDAGVIGRELLALYSDGRHLQHWPNHDNHIHIRVSEAAYETVDGGAGTSSIPLEFFEEP
ncbi:MAG: hypothetical protein HYY84_16455 [Deltaproteobacteria bacterium]|nr:hypothetical protein [Deltaproteobacteria bacterium]